MRKVLMLWASAALLLTGCAKDQPALPEDGHLTAVSFNAQLDGEMATKGVSGTGGNVNRCIMEVYYGEALFVREYAQVTGLAARFQTSLVSNRTYRVVFWADHVENPSNAIATDMFYSTGIEGQGLQAVTLMENYCGNSDERDAFFHSGTYPVPQAGASFEGIVLTRPFAQVNVVTTDVQDFTSGSAPDKVSVTIQNVCTVFNLLTQELSGKKNLSYVANLYEPLSSPGASQATLSMDYIFSSTEKEMVNMEWKTVTGETSGTPNTLSSVPVQRNFRTNITGRFLTSSGD